MTQAPAGGASPYAILETLSEADGTTLYRATRRSDGRPVLLKVLDPRLAAPEALERLKREYAFARGLESGAAVMALALETHQGLPTLALEDFGGRPLGPRLGAPMEVGAFLDLAVRIASAVAQLHQLEVLHKDLRPENVLLNAATGEVRLTGFGLASRLPREHQPPQSPSRIEGSLPYLAPERTGRMNRATDARADLYSLGVTFYQLLTGRLPFEAADPLEWVYCHVARVPASPSKLAPGVPAQLGRLVLRLLAKMPEERYQSARGLRHDLERCREQWRARGQLEAFPLGQRDASDRLQLPQRLYGREAERETLLAAFERVQGAGASELLLVTGPPGIGKSALVHELHRPVTRQHGLFASGKFDPHQRDVPYSTFVQAFRGLVLELLAESQERLAAWRDQLKAALGAHGQLIAEVIPQVELVIGRQAPPPPLPPAEAQNRFHGALRRFISVFAQQEHPLVLFLDDLQWADLASLALLQELVTHPEVRFLLVVGAYRSAEVTAAHPLSSTLESARREGARLTQLELGPLSEEQLTALVSDVLHRPGPEAAPLARLILEKTAGNPFFTTQFLASLGEERLIEFDAEQAAWRWDLPRIRARGLTDNVVELMIGKLRRLPASTREVLTRIACLGDNAELALLTAVLGKSGEEVGAATWEAERAGFLLRVGEAYRFLHDRVQEAAYALVPEEARPALHLGIGRLLIARLPPQAVAERVFAVANQLNLGAALITEPAERADLVRLNLQAGRKARAATAFASARSYLAAARALLPPEAWEAAYATTFPLYLDLAECEFLVGHFEEADALFGLLIGRARTNPERARAYFLRMKLLQITGRPSDGVSSMIEAMRLFGVAFPESGEALLEALATEQREVAANLRGRPIADLAEAPVATDPDVRAMISLLAGAMPCAYIGRPEFFPLIVVRALNLSLRHGSTEDSCFAYSAYSTLLVSLFGDVHSAFAFSEMSRRLNERFGDVRLRGTILYLHAIYVHCWGRPFASVGPLLEEAFPACLEAGDLVMAAYHGAWSTWLSVEKGDTLEETLRATRKYLAFCRESHNELVARALRAMQQFAAALQGRTRDLASFDADDFSEAEWLAAVSRANFGTVLALFHIMKQVVAYLAGRYDEALAWAARAAPLMGSVLGAPIEATHHFYLALTQAALHPGAPAERQRELKGGLQRALKKLAFWAESCPANYLNRLALVAAEVARLEGRPLDAEPLYEQAIRSARENDLAQNEALALELASRFYRARGLEPFADLYLGQARAAYLRWGAQGKAQQLDRLHPHLRERPAAAPNAPLSLRAEQLDLLSVIKASQTISGEIVLDQLVHTLLRVALEQGGAQRGYLLLTRGDALSVEAEARLGEPGLETRLLPSPPAATSGLVPASVVEYAARTGERVILDDAALPSRFSADPYFAEQRPRSVLGLPILRQARVVGLLYLENDVLAGAFSAERLTALALLASQAAISLQNARFLAEERAQREASEAAERRSAFLARAGALLSESLDYERALTRLVQLCVRSLADWCVVDLLEGQAIRRVAGAHADPAREPLLGELQRRYPPYWASPQASAQVLRSGEPILVPEFSEVHLERLTLGGEHTRLIRSLGLESLMTVPLGARGQRIGALTLASTSKARRYGPADLQLAQEVAHRAAIAIDNARLHRETQEAVRLRDEFLSVASHELNTPMTALRLALQSMARAAPEGRPRDPQLLSRQLALALHQGERMTHLIGSLLEVSWLEQGQLPLEPEELELGALVREVAERFGPELARARCPLDLHAEEPVLGRWDRSRLEQVVMNLLSNAAKFGPGRPIAVRVERAGDRARLTVRDQGMGIAPEQQARLFGRFERGVSAKHYGGLGLGLYICRRIAEAHGGSIRVESRPGEGATFTVELPGAAPRLAEARPPAPGA